MIDEDGGVCGCAGQASLRCLGVVGKTRVVQVKVMAGSTVDTHGQMTLAWNLPNLISLAQPHSNRARNTGSFALA